MKGQESLLTPQTFDRFPRALAVKRKIASTLCLCLQEIYKELCVLSRKIPYPLRIEEGVGPFRVSKCFLVLTR